MYYTPIYWLSIVFICLTTKIGKCPLFWVFSIRLQLLYVCLAEYFSKNILVSKSFAKKFGLWNIKKDSFASFFFVWSILNSQWAFYANGPHTKRILQQGGKFIAGVPFNFLWRTHLFAILVIFNAIVYIFMAFLNNIVLDLYGFMMESFYHDII